MAVTRTAGIILAAGSSTRFGGQKLLANANGVPLVQHVIDAANASALDPVFLVVGHASDAVLAAVRLGRAEVVRNPEWSTGQASSLRAGCANETVRRTTVGRGSSVMTTRNLAWCMRYATPGHEVAGLLEDDQLLLHGREHRAGLCRSDARAIARPGALVKKEPGPRTGLFSGRRGVSAADHAWPRTGAGTLVGPNTTSSSGVANACTNPAIDRTAIAMASA